MPITRASAALAACVCLAAPNAAGAQIYNLGTLPAMLEVAASTDLARSNLQGAQVLRVISFGVDAFKLNGLPQLMFEAQPMQAAFVESCPGMPPTSVLPNPPRPAANAWLPVVGWYQNYMPGAFGLKMTMADPLKTLSVDGNALMAMTASAAPEARLSAAWGQAVTLGRSETIGVSVVQRNVSQPIARSIVVPVNPVYELKNVAYEAKVSLRSYVARRADGGEELRNAAPGASYAVGGYLAGGRWYQGSGFLVIPVGETFPGGQCMLGARVVRVGPDVLARYGVPIGTPFVPGHRGAYYKDWDSQTRLPPGAANWNF